MRADPSIAVPLFLVLAMPAVAQSPPRPADSTPPAARTAAGPPVIACASLANLRTVLRGVNDDAGAAIPVITDPKSDLGCAVLDRNAVTGIADHVVLNGRAYDCLALQSTSVCQWTIAGSATPVAPHAAPVRDAPATRPPEKGRR